MNCGPNRRERTRGFPRSVDELRPFIKDILILVLRVERVRVVHDNAEPRCSHFVFVLKLHVQLDSVAPQTDVVPLVSWQPESQRESESIDVEANRLRHISGTKNRLDLTERCGVHKALTICRSDESSSQRPSKLSPTTILLLRRSGRRRLLGVGRARILLHAARDEREHRGIPAPTAEAKESPGWPAKIVAAF